MINTEPELKKLINRAINAPCIALDTEFFWERTFYPILGVVQVGFSQTDCHLIDAIALPTLPGFGKLLRNESTVKILHDALQDLSILSRITNATPCTVFDTRTAAGFCKLESTLSLANLLKTTMDIEIPKTETRSNWLKRPLTTSQIAYALNDVRFLPELREILIKKATSLGNQNYLAEEMRQCNEDDYYKETSPADIYKRIKSGRLRGKSKNVLFELIIWRENVARARNIPRGHVMNNSALISLAFNMPEDRHAIRNIQGVPRSASTHYSNKLLEAVAKGIASKKSITAAPGERPSAEIKRLITKRSAAIHEAATKAGIDPLLVATKAMVTELVLAEQSENDLFPNSDRPALPTPSLKKNWRKNFI